MYRIWVEMFVNGEHVGTMLSCKCYKRKGYAEYIARTNYHSHGNIVYKWNILDLPY